MNCHIHDYTIIQAIWCKSLTNDEKREVSEEDTHMILKLRARQIDREVSHQQQGLGSNQSQWINRNSITETFISYACIHRSRIQVSKKLLCEKAQNNKNEIRCIFLERNFFLHPILTLTRASSTFGRCSGSIPINIEK